jgi:hypothetical protein
MERSCFVIMPISDIEPYPVGHFKRVYEFIIKPAVLNAGFTPIRADDVLNTNYIAIDVIRRIINSDMAICDLSSRNPNVFYELGIRQAFDKPVTLIRDSITERAFDVQGFRDAEYDENLRIDNVESSIGLITNLLQNTYKEKGQEVNSLVSLLGIHPSRIKDTIEISKETQIILNALDNFASRLTEIQSAIPSINNRRLPLDDYESEGIWEDFVPNNSVALDFDDVVDHPKFGKGKIVGKEGNAHNPIVSVRFQSGDMKKLMVNYIKVKRLVKAGKGDAGMSK